MKLIGNILWFIFGGLLSALMWLLSGVLWCVSIVGIPYGLQCFKFAKLSLWPFGKEIDYGGGTVSMIANLIWVVFFGIEMALAHLAVGALWCLTIVGIPFGKQFFKLAKLSLLPFGAQVRETE
ncbi:MAG: YccF domain-containing protein [Peptococcaceae bacterium]|nr:YccF domain-containing protein [Peptococcaceae bacterium]